MGADLVSVIMPVYNAGKYVAAAIESILNQSYPYFEFLIFDDGSTDNSFEIIKSYKDPRIKYIRSEKNIGYVQHLNEGIRLANGKYIARMDADDVSMPARFQQQVDFLEQNSQIALVGSVAFYIDENGYTQKYAFQLPLQHQAMMARMLFKTSIIHPTVMMRRSVTQTYAYKEELIPAEDYDLWTRIGAEHSLANLKNQLLYCRIHSENIHRAKLEKTVYSMATTHRNQLLRYGIPFSEENLEHHIRIAVPFFFNSEINASTLKKLEKYLYQLITWNKEHSKFEEDIFQTQMGLIWKEFCLSSSKHMDISSFIKMMRSDLFFTATNRFDRVRIFYLFLSKYWVVEKLGSLIRNFRLKKI